MNTSQNIIFFISTLFSLHISCSYPPILDKKLCYELNTIQRSIASNDTSNNKIITNLQTFITNYKKEALSLSNKSGNTLISEASFRRRLPVVKYLLDNNANTNIIDKHGNTALHRACRKINNTKYKEYAKEYAIEIIKLLIDRIEHVSLVNRHKKRPIDLINENTVFSDEEKSELVTLITNRTIIINQQYNDTLYASNLDSLFVIFNHNIPSFNHTHTNWHKNNFNNKQRKCMQQLYSQKDPEQIALSLICTDDQTTIEFAIDCIFRNDNLSFMQKEPLITFAFSKICPSSNWLDRSESIEYTNTDY